MYRFVIYSIILSTFLFVNNCSSETDYESMVRKGLESGIEQDSLFLGYYLGMSRDDFFSSSWEMNKQGIITGYTKIVYELQDLFYPANMEFYPLFLNDGAIGELNFVESYWDRQSFTGAWNYSMPPSAGPHNIDWDTYLKDLPKIPFDPEKFFRWRKYRDFGTGVAGDLFVHHFSALHFITGSKGPERIYSTGGIRFWDDGRNVPDVMLGVFDYPETENHTPFNLSLRVNFADGSGGGSTTRMVGTDGELIWGGGELKLKRSPMAEVPDLSIDNYSESVREEYMEYHTNRYPDPGPMVQNPNELTYRVTNSVNGTAHHHKTLFDAIRHGSDIVQDATFGLRAAAPALAANKSYYENTPVNWDPEKMQII